MDAEVDRAGGFAGRTSGSRLTSLRLAASKLTFKFFEPHVARALADPYADETVVPVNSVAELVRQREPAPIHRRAFGPALQSRPETWLEPAPPTRGSRLVPRDQRS